MEEERDGQWDREAALHLREEASARDSHSEGTDKTLKTAMSLCISSYVFSERHSVASLLRPSFSVN